MTASASETTTRRPPSLRSRLLGAASVGGGAGPGCLPAVGCGAVQGAVGSLVDTGRVITRLELGHATGYGNGYSLPVMIEFGFVDAVAELVHGFQRFTNRGIREQDDELLTADAR